MNMEESRIVTEDVDLSVSKSGDECLLEMLSEDNNMEMYLTRDQIKELIKGLTDLL